MVAICHFGWFLQFIRLRLLLVLLFQTIEHVGYPSDDSVLWIYDPRLLYVLSDAGNGGVLCFAQIRALHICQFKNGLILNVYVVVVKIK